MYALSSGVCLLFQADNVTLQHPRVFPIQLTWRRGAYGRYDMTLRMNVLDVSLEICFTGHIKYDGGWARLVFQKVPCNIQCAMTSLSWKRQVRAPNTSHEGSQNVRYQEAMTPPTRRHRLVSMADIISHVAKRPGYSGLFLAFI